MKSTNSENTKQHVRTVYEKGAQRHDTEHWLKSGGTARVPESRSAHYFIDRKVSVALALANMPSDASVLEVGCSFGQMTFLLAKHFREVVAIDFSPEAVALTRKRAQHYNIENVQLDVADAEDLSLFQDGVFDGVVSFSVLRYVPELDRALAEIFRVLRSGGSIALDFPNKYCPWFGPVRKLFGIKPHVHDHLFSASEVVKLLGSVGFTDLKYKHMLFTTRRLPDKLLPLFKIIDAVGEKLPLINRLAGIIMVTGKKT